MTGTIQSISHYKFFGLLISFYKSNILFWRMRERETGGQTGMIRPRRVSRPCGCWDTDGMMFSRVSLPCGHQHLVRTGSSSTWRWGRGIKRSVRVNRVNIWVMSLVERCEVPLRAYSQGKRKDTFWKIGINILLPGFELTNASPVLIRWATRA